MWLDAILAYLHFAAIFTLVWFLAKEWTLLRSAIDAIDFKRIANADLGFGLAAVAVLVTGALRVFYGAKGAAFYLHNPVFHVKVALFVVVGLVSIAPTLAFLRWRRAWREDAAFRVALWDVTRVRRFVMVELHLIALIPFAAVMMARGLR